MKTLINYIKQNSMSSQSEYIKEAKQNFIIKGHTTSQQPGTIPSNNPYFTDGTASEDLVFNAFQGDAETQWSETHKGEIIEYTTTYFNNCIKNKTKLTPEEFGSDFIAYLEQFLDDIPKKEKNALETQLISLIREEC